MSDGKKSAWDHYRRWNKISRIAQCVALPTWIGLVFADSLHLSQAILFPVFLLCVFLEMPARNFRCPKCDEFFFFKPFGFNWNFSPQKCVHCGLPKWEEPPEKTEIYPIPRKSAPRPDPAIAESARLKNFLTLVLRDDPRAIGLKLDSEGWTAVDQLFTRAGKYGVKFTPNALEKLMGEDGNPGFEWNRATQRIRAIQI